MIYFKLDVKPYTYPLLLKRKTIKEVLKEFPDAYDLQGVEE
jgi:hypothetical protein